jgi:predicted permease
VGAALFLRSLTRAQAVDPGFDPDNVVLMSFALEAQGYNQARTRAFYDQLLERARALPGVEGATLATSVPLGGSYGRRGTRIEGYTPGPGESTEINWNVVGADYFRVMRVPVMRGRAFTDLDRDGAPPVVVINEAFARRYWPGQDPIGKGISVTGPEGPFRAVVGVVADGKYRSLAEDPLPYMYLPFGQQYRAWMTVHVRSAGDPGPVLARLRQEVRSLDPNVPIVNPTTLKEQVGIAVLPQRLAATLLSAFGVLAVLLAAIGLYGVMAYAVSRRTREFGIRTALGATWHDVVRQVVGEGLVLAATGVIVGLAVAAVVTRFARAFLFDVSPLDPIAFGAVTALLLGVTALASYVPARRATRVDPMVALRYE